MRLLVPGPVPVSGGMGLGCRMGAGEGGGLPAGGPPQRWACSHLPCFLVAAFLPALLHWPFLDIFMPSQDRMQPGPALVHIVGQGRRYPGDEGQGSPVVGGSI